MMSDTTMSEPKSERSPPAALRIDDGFAGAGDEFYAELLAAHAGLSDAQSAALNARLVLLLANQIGDLSVIRAALSAARASMAHENPP